MGVWYLVYDGFDAMENEIGLAQVEEKEELEASTEQEAIKEAKKLWATLSKRKNTYKGWDGVTYPHSPRLIYEVALS